MCNLWDEKITKYSQSHRQDPAHWQHFFSLFCIVLGAIHQLTKPHTHTNTNHHISRLVHSHQINGTKQRETMKKKTVFFLWVTNFLNELNWLFLRMDSHIISYSNIQLAISFYLILALIPNRKCHFLVSKHRTKSIPKEIKTNKLFRFKYDFQMNIIEWGQNWIEKKKKLTVFPLQKNEIKWNNGLKRVEHTNLLYWKLKILTFF